VLTLIRPGYEACQRQRASASASKEYIIPRPHVLLFDVATPTFPRDLPHLSITDPLVVTLAAA
jgi:hypothetical protein